MVYASTATWFTPAKAHPTEAGRKRVRQEVPTYTEEGRKRVRQNMEFPEARQVRFDDEAAAAAQEVVSWPTLLRPTSGLRSRCGWALAGVLA